MLHAELLEHEWHIKQLFVYIKGLSSLLHNIDHVILHRVILASSNSHMAIMFMILMQHLTLYSRNVNVIQIRS